MQTDRHGHPPIGVSSCPVVEIGRWGDCLQRPALARNLLGIHQFTQQCKGADADRPLLCTFIRLA